MCLLLLTGLSPFASADMASAGKALAQGRADDAARQLGTLVAAQPSDPQTHQLLCRVYYAEEMADAAIKECEQAVSLAPDDSGNQLWAGKAYGLKASSAGPFAGLSLAKKVRTSFERAVQLDARNIAAASALGEYYVEAPGLVGGGLDKAERLASQVEGVSPVAAHRLRGMIAEKRKDTAKAEDEYRQAIAASHNSAEAWVDLGNFYQRQKQPDQVVSAMQSALDADRARDAALMDIASILSDANRSADVAERALRLYLASPNKSEEAPAFRVHVQLGKLLAQRGDHNGARQEYQAALALASGYAPARKALEGG
ncbi:MAG TPA: tetratricopeptide repeat protein [Granulicella sp.]